MNCCENCKKVTHQDFQNLLTMVGKEGVRKLTYKIERSDSAGWMIRVWLTGFGVLDFDYFQGEWLFKIYFPDGFYIIPVEDKVKYRKKVKK